MSIAQKVTLVVSLLAGLLLGGAGYTVEMLQSEQRIELTVRTGRMLGRAMGQAALAAVSNHGHLGELADLASQQQPRLPLSVTFFGPDARAIAPVPPEETPVVNGRARRVIEQKKIHEELARDAPSPAFVYRAPLFAGKRVAGALELRLGLPPPSRDNHVPLLVAGGLLVLFAGLVWLFSQRTFGRPISSLMEGIDEVIKGDLTAALPLERSDEIGRIAYRFNEMTAQLRAAQEEITRSASARLQLEQTLSQSEKLATIGQLSAEIAHEVGTPLNVIGGRARVLERKADRPDEVRKNARIIADQAARITKIIQQMLDLARAKAPQYGPVEVAAIIDEAVAFLEYQTAQGGIAVVREVPADLPLVFGNADGLQQVLLNLLLNAIQAIQSTQGGGRVRVTVERQHRRKEGLDLAPPEPYLVVAVEDNGGGISDEARAQVFEPFYSTKDEGTGLGLTVVHGIVKQHDGWIEVDAAEPHGTVFRVYLPTGERGPTDEEHDEHDPRDEHDAHLPPAGEQDAAEHEAGGQDATEHEVPRDDRREPAEG